MNLPTPTLTAPVEVVNTKVKKIEYTNNPIKVHFENGILWQLTKKQWDFLDNRNKAPQTAATVQMEIYKDGTVKAFDIISLPSGTKTVPKNVKKKKKLNSRNNVF